MSLFRDELEALQIERDTCDSPFAAYEPLPGQIAFHNSDARQRWLICSNQFGKTKCGAAEVLGDILGIDPVTHQPVRNLAWHDKRKWRACGDSFQHGIEGIIVPELQKFLHKDQYEYRRQEQRMLISGPRGVGEIQFRTYDQDIKKHAGEKLHGVWFDEEPPRAIYIENNKRLIRFHGRIICTMTPDSGVTWTYNDVLMAAKRGDSDIAVFSGSMVDNDYLLLNQIRKSTKDMSPEELESTLFGNYASLTGLVYREFDPAVHVVEPFPIPKEGYALCVGIDHGLNNPTAAIWFAVSRAGAIYAVREYYATTRSAYDNACHIKEITEREFGYLPFLYYAIDPSTENREGVTLTSVWNEYQRAGLFCRTSRVPVQDGIDFVKSLFKVRVTPEGQRIAKLYYFRKRDTNLGVPILTNETNQYQWADVAGTKDVNGLERPRKFSDHGKDAERYCLQERPSYMETDTSLYDDSVGFEPSSSWGGY